VAESGQRAVYAFQVWEIDLLRRELRSRGAVVPLGSRAFDILEVLVQSNGEVVNKYDVMKRVWPKEEADDGKLRVHVSAIRKALGADNTLLKTISARGYCLLGTWTMREPSRLGNPLNLNPGKAFRTNLPAAVLALIGRDAVKQQLLDILSGYRVVTLTGPGGIGKTALGLDLARNVFPAFGGDCWFAEFASVLDPNLVPSKLAAIIGLKIGAEQISAEAVARAIAGERLLLLLDNCEHIIDVAATLVETIVRMCPHVSIISTSREVLRVEGEYVHRVAPLDVPPLPPEGPGDVQHYSAVQLFIARTAALDSGFSIRPEQFSAIAAICRRLDGIPLAIEFAAAHAVTFGLEELATRLQDRFTVMTAGRRTALARHQTLRATFDWSYGLLSELEKTLFRRLGVFLGGFTLTGANAVMKEIGVSEADIFQAVANLVAKSLVAFEAPSGRWSLLETMRVFARHKLAEHREREMVARYHAEFFRDLVVPSVSVARLLPTEALALYASEIDNVRAAIEWSFSSNGAAEIGVALTAGYGPVWLDLSLLRHPMVTN
jgi:predicted ATPase/DNA-binding winged helix-turn-helix (wHTH) protein